MTIIRYILGIPCIFIGSFFFWLALFILPDKFFKDGIIKSLEKQLEKKGIVIIRK